MPHAYIDLGSLVSRKKIDRGILGIVIDSYLDVVGTFFRYNLQKDTWIERFKDFGKSLEDKADYMFGK